jgi:hypothetical protein
MEVTYNEVTKRSNLSQGVTRFARIKKEKKECPYFEHIYTSYLRYSNRVSYHREILLSTDYRRCEAECFT